MLLNVSYNNKDINRQIDHAVGKAYSWRERIRLGGIGSPPLEITEASREIRELLDLDQNRNLCYIELRPKGIVIRFRSILETYALVIPYDKLELEKEEWDSFSMRNGDAVITVHDVPNAARRFYKRMMSSKERSLDNLTQ